MIAVSFTICVTKTHARGIVERTTRTSDREGIQKDDFRRIVHRISAPGALNAMDAFGAPMNRLFIVIPAYNEQANIEKVIEQWYPLVERHGIDSRLVVIDDGSTDDTYALVCEAARSRPALVPLTKGNEGHGATLLFGYRFALDAGADYVFQTDSDGQTDPAEFEQFWDVRDAYDISLGKRIAREDGFSRVCVTKVLKAVIKHEFSVSVEDANSPYRLIKAAALRDCLAYIPEGYRLPNVVMCVACAKFGYSTNHFPITFHARQGGKNSINAVNITGIGMQALQDFKQINKALNAEMGRRANRLSSSSRDAARVESLV